MNLNLLTKVKKDRSPIFVRPLNFVRAARSSASTYCWLLLHPLATMLPHPCHHGNYLTYTWETAQDSQKPKIGIGGSESRTLTKLFLRACYTLQA